MSLVSAPVHNFFPKKFSFDDKICQISKNLFWKSSLIKHFYDILNLNPHILQSTNPIYISSNCKKYLTHPPSSLNLNNCSDRNTEYHSQTSFGYSDSFKYWVDWPILIIE